jgi:hypothetical protein
VAWSNHFAFDVSGAAARPDGTLYLCNGAFNTDLYTATRTSLPRLVARISVDITALAYGRGTLWGFSNYATPKGIYEIDQSSGQATLVLDVYTGTGFRFFALDYNTADGLLYGYTEYGDSGLYSINLDTGEMIKLVGTIPAANGQGRGMAVGNNIVYLTATRGDDEIPYFSYDLSQGPNGEWIAFTQPYPQYHSTGGAAWIADPFSLGDLNCDGTIDALDIEPFLVALFDPENYPIAYPDCDISLADLNGDGDINALDIEGFLAVLFP